MSALSTPTTGKSLFDKLWDAHLVSPEQSQAPAVLYIDLHLIHEVTSPQAFAELAERGIAVRRANRTIATLDHATPTTPVNQHGEHQFVNEQARAQVAMLRANCKRFGIECFDFGSDQRGIVHVIGPEMGVTQPGMTIVCGDSHTATHGAFGALAFGIGTSEVAHVLATQCLLQRKPKSMAIDIDGELPAGVSAKDLILHVIAEIGVHGGTGYVIEYRGAAIRRLSMEQRMTVCNMSIEAGARAGLIAADDTTFAYLQNKPRVPQGAAFAAAKQYWAQFVSDDNAAFDRHVQIEASTNRPRMTRGKHPGQGIAIGDQIPNHIDADIASARNYMGWQAAETSIGRPVDVVFVGSCTNGRLSDIAAVAEVLRNRKVHPRVRMLVVPGSDLVKRDAEQAGYAQIIREAGAEWREPGCSMCIAMNGDVVGAGQLAVSTSNRNFEGRQGKGSRTILVSPETAAACAIAGALSLPENYRHPATVSTSLANQPSTQAQA